MAKPKKQTKKPKANRVRRKKQPVKSPLDKYLLDDPEPCPDRINPEDLKFLI